MRPSPHILGLITLAACSGSQITLAGPLAFRPIVVNVGPGSSSGVAGGTTITLVGGLANQPTDFCRSIAGAGGCCNMPLPTTLVIAISNIDGGSVVGPGIWPFGAVVDAGIATLEYSRLGEGDGGSITITQVVPTGSDAKIDGFFSTTVNGESLSGTFSL